MFLKYSVWISPVFEYAISFSMLFVPKKWFGVKILNQAQWDAKAKS